MGRYKKILVAFDGSESGTNALLQAFRLANDEECWITVATVVPAYDGDIDLTGVTDIHAALRRTGEEILSRANGIAKKEGALIKTVLEEGESSERLVALAESENCGIIVMGRRGVSRFERSLIGSVAARVIGHSGKDVLVVPSDTVIGWKNILLATDGSKYSAVATGRAIDFAKSYGGELMAISIVDVPAEFYAEAPKAVEDMTRKAKEFVAEVKKKAEASGIKTTKFVGEGDAYKVITDLAKKEKADVIFMGSHGRTGLTKLLMGSVTEKVIGYASCPVLVVKA
ncbi:MAG: UspA domain-containing protein [Nitrospirae bacterium]|nr:MAG: UspA domain-containing protein [Nitrospirota bacterium]